MEFMEAINRYESEVRSYVRSFPTVFEKARGSYLYNTDGTAYLDFFAGASVMNYGHNHPELKKALIDYLEGDNIIHSLDMASVARAEFLQAYHDIILAPRGMNHRIQIPGPTGTNAVESALKIARKAKQRAGLCRLHQRLPRHDAGLAVGHRQSVQARRRRRAAVQHRIDALRQLLWR
ncbi:MAG: aminotransferase class III-fold pyridoxal phosphate-dependent enzyme [Arhodomonas sp.]|nr:aminotransferase class III-fold pyridoxal phosphate-dependent enzyme [Arhodomonas sp.]